jgi:hypothetical protein
MLQMNHSIRMMRQNASFLRWILLTLLFLQASAIPLPLSLFYSLNGAMLDLNALYVGQSAIYMLFSILYQFRV